MQTNFPVNCYVRFLQSSVFLPVWRTLPTATPQNTSRLRDPHQTLQFSIWSSVLPDSIPYSRHDREEEKEGRICLGLFTYLCSAGINRKTKLFTYKSWFLGLSFNFKKNRLEMGSSYSFLKGFFSLKRLSCWQIYKNGHVMHQFWAGVPVVTEVAQNHGVAQNKGLAGY